MVKNVFFNKSASMVTAGKIPIDRNYIARLGAFLFMILITGLLFVFISFQMKKIVSSISTADYKKASIAP